MNSLKLLFRKSTIKVFDDKLKLLNLKDEFDGGDILSYELIICILIYIFFLSTSHHGFLISTVTSIIFLVLTNTLLFNIPIKKRKITLEKEYLSFLKYIMFILPTNSLLNTFESYNKTHNTEISKLISKVTKNVNLGSNIKDEIIKLKDEIPSRAIYISLLKIIDSYQLKKDTIKEIEKDKETFETIINNNKETKLITKLLTYLLLTVVLFIIIIFIYNTL